MQSYAYCVTCQKPTSVNQALVCTFTNPTARNLILAKGNHLEIHTLAEDGLVPEIDVPIYGKISALNIFTMPNTSQNLLFVLTDKKHFCVLGWDGTAKKFITRSTGNFRVYGEFTQPYRYHHTLFMYGIWKNFNFFSNKYLPN